MFYNNLQTYAFYFVTAYIKNLGWQALKQPDLQGFFCDKKYLINTRLWMSQNMAKMARQRKALTIFSNILNL